MQQGNCSAHDLEDDGDHCSSGIYYSDFLLPQHSQVRHMHIWSSELGMQPNLKQNSTQMFNILQLTNL